LSFQGKQEILSRSDKSGLISLRVPRIAFKGDRTCTFGHARAPVNAKPSSLLRTRRIDLRTHARVTRCICSSLLESRVDPLRLIFLHFVFAFSSPDGHARGARRTLIAINCYALACPGRILLHYERVASLFTRRLSLVRIISYDKIAHYASDNSGLIKSELISEYLVRNLRKEIRRKIFYNSFHK